MDLQITEVLVQVSDENLITFLAFLIMTITNGFISLKRFNFYFTIRSRCPEMWVHLVDRIRYWLGP